MDSARAEEIDLDVLGADELRAMLRAKNAQLVEKDVQIKLFSTQIESLKLLILKLRRLQYGQRSEKRAREIEQLELRLEELETSSAQIAAATPIEKSAREPRAAKARRTFPDHLPREVRTIEPAESSCPNCGGVLKHLGDDVCETLELEPIRFKVICEVREKQACTKCDVIVQAKAPSRPIDRGMAGPGLLAHVLVQKYADHVPLYRQCEIYARQGVELDRSLLAQWTGAMTALLKPLAESLKAHVLASGVVHTDDTPIPVLAPGQGKTKTGRLWTYVRDERPCGGTIAPAVWFAYSPDRKGEHPQHHLLDFKGVLQVDGYAGYGKIFERGTVFEAACWAHVRRDFFDLHKLHKSAVAEQMMLRVGALYAIEAEIKGLFPDERRAVRQARSVPLLDEMKPWLEQTLATLSQKSALAKAISYALNRWEALLRYAYDGRLEIDNNAAERALRAVALGRKNYLFAGSDNGGETAAAIYSLLGTAKLNGINPEFFLREVLSRIADHPIDRIAELLPWNLAIAGATAIASSEKPLPITTEA